MLGCVKDLSMILNRQPESIAFPKMFRTLLANSHLSKHCTELPNLVKLNCQRAVLASGLPSWLQAVSPATTNTWDTVNRERDSKGWNKVDDRDLAKRRWVLPSSAHSYQPPCGETLPPGGISRHVWAGGAEKKRKVCVGLKGDKTFVSFSFTDRSSGR